MCENNQQLYRNKHCSIMQLWFVRIIWLPFNLVCRTLDSWNWLHNMSSRRAHWYPKQQNTNLRWILSINVLRQFHIKFGKFNLVSCLVPCKFDNNFQLVDHIPVKTIKFFNMNRNKSSILPYFTLVFIGPNSFNWFYIQQKKLSWIYSSIWTN